MKLLHMVRAIKRSQTSSCVSTRVGAVVVMDGLTVSYGVNGTVDHKCRCELHNKHMLTDDGKLAAKHRPDHSAWSNDNEIHAEMNALLSAHLNGVILKNAALYTTASPCPQCAKHIELYAASQAITAVYYLDKYDRGNNEWISRLRKYGCIVEQIKREEFEPYLDFSDVVFNNNE